MQYEMTRNNFTRLNSIITFEARSVKREFIATYSINNNYYIMMPEYK